MWNENMVDRLCYISIRCSVQFSRSVISDSERPHEPPPCPSPTPRVHQNPCPLSQGCHQTISSSSSPFPPSHQYFPASESFPMSQLFASGGQSLEFSFSISPSNEHPGLISLGWTGWISLQSKELSRVFSNTIVQKHQFFGA